LETPCVNICLIDSDAGLCIGCGRTIDEISRWGAMTPVERREIMACLAARLETIESVKEPT
jgi:predicted Fe-S protein YdhL (DUF1289 family)